MHAWVDHSRVQVLLEKRLGIAQLSLLLTVLVFMALTRGSRSEPLQTSASLDVRSRTSSIKGLRRGWPGRTLNLSGEWVSKLKSVSPDPGSPSSVNTADLNGKGDDRETTLTGYDTRLPGKLSLVMCMYALN